MTRCARCRRSARPIARARAIGAYDGALRAIIHALKYDGRRTVARPLAALMLLRAGTLVDGVMRMEGTVEYVEPNRVVAFRGSWKRNDDGRVRQRLEEFDLGAQAWVVWFDGFYRHLD